MSDKNSTPNVTYNVVEQPTVKQQLVQTGIALAAPLAVGVVAFGTLNAYDKVASTVRRRRAARKNNTEDTNK